MPNVTRKRRKLEGPVFKSYTVQPVVRAPRFGPARPSFHPVQQTQFVEQVPYNGGTFVCPGGADVTRYVIPQPIQRALVRSQTIPYKPRSEFKPPRAKIPKIQKQDMVPGEQSTVTRVLKWVPIQVINSKDSAKVASNQATDNRSGQKQFVTETTHAYVPVAEMQSSGGTLCSQTIPTETSTTSSLSHLVHSVPSLPSIQTMLDTVADSPLHSAPNNNLMHAQNQPQTAFIQHTNYYHQDETKGFNVADLPNGPQVYNVQWPPQTSPEDQEISSPPADKDVPNNSEMTVSGDSHVFDAPSTGQCISSALSTLLEENVKSQVRVQLEKPADDSVPNESGSHDRRQIPSITETSREMSPLPVRDTIPNHYGQNNLTLNTSELAHASTIYRYQQPTPIGSYEQGTCAQQPPTQPHTAAHPSDVHQSGAHPSSPQQPVAPGWYGYRYPHPGYGFYPAPQQDLQYLPHGMSLPETLTNV